MRRNKLYKFLGGVVLAALFATTLISGLKLEGGGVLSDALGLFASSQAGTDVQQAEAQGASEDFEAEQAVATSSDGSVSFEQVDNSLVSANVANGALTEDTSDDYTPVTQVDSATNGSADGIIDAETIDPNTQVRVSIMLEADSALDAGLPMKDAGQSAEVDIYRSYLDRQQEQATQRIEEAIGEALDVKWNLTLVANLISATVKYGQIEAIQAVAGVKDVVLEQTYQPIDDDEESSSGTLSDIEGDSSTAAAGAASAQNDGGAASGDGAAQNDGGAASGDGAADSADAQPNQAIATSTTGSTGAWSAGYTGAGMRIAVIDTGIDTDHVSFAEEDYLYALSQDAASAGQNADTYIASLDLLDTEELKEAIPKLNAYKTKNSSITADDVHVSDKIAYGFNYVDSTLDITHDNDSQGDHGSHVSGIAAANRYVTIDGTRYDALSQVKVSGDAPDAQILTMKVFGKAGGASNSDYMAAIEDAIVLGADAINLSLGSSTTGFSYSGNSTYDGILDSLSNSDVVVSISAGNDGAWGEDSAVKSFLGTGYLYTEDVNYDEIGFPASYTNAMTVASVDNAGTVTEASLAVRSASGEEKTFAYSETMYNNMKTFGTLDPTNGENGGTEYEYVFIDGLGQEGDYEGMDVEGKIVFCQRGTTTFYQKATYAASCGAAALVIYNNVDGTFNMDLSSYTDEMPCVNITKTAGAEIKAMSTQQITDDWAVYYTGTARVNGAISVVDSSSTTYSMSYYTAWGTTGDLSLKPEVSAPGGSIRSVRGDSTTSSYKLNSGTSMASPQVAGVSALIAQYVQNTGLEEQTGLSQRQLVQSLLMSTANPLKDADGNYYSLLQQGAGMIDADAAVSSSSYVTMGEGAGKSAADGKVKAEVGDDPQRSGVFEFDFTLNNISSEDIVFDLSADVFTQDYTTGVSNEGSSIEATYQTYSTRSLDSATTFTSENASISGGAVTVTAGGSATIHVKVSVTDAGKEWLESVFERGTYIQAFVYANPRANAEGVVASAHSIPMLGFYGSWTDPSMFDGTGYSQGELTTNYATTSMTDKSRSPYAIAYDVTEGGYNVIESYGRNYLVANTEGAGETALGGNPLVADETYDPERNAIADGAVLVRWNYSLMRDSTQLFYNVVNSTTGETYVSEQFSGQYYGNFISSSESLWQQPTTTTWINSGSGYALPSASEGDVIYAEFTALPEYYNEGEQGEGKSGGLGSTISISLTVDNSAPSASAFTYDAADGQIDVSAADDNHISGIVLFDEAGQTVISYTGSNPDAQKGAESVFSVDAQDGGSYLLQVFDYAMNAATYRISVDSSKSDALEFSGTMLAYDLDTLNWAQIEKAGSEPSAVTDSTRTYTAAAAVGDVVYAVAYGNELYRLSVSDLETPSFVCAASQNLTDLAYNEADGMLYGISQDGKIVRINLAASKASVVGNAPVVASTLACDADGVFYSAQSGTGKVYTYTLDSLKSGSAAYDFDGSGAFGLSDVRALLGYVSGARGAISHADAADVDGDGTVGSHDAQALLAKAPGYYSLLCDVKIPSSGVQALEIDPNSGKLYWASHYTDSAGNISFDFSFLYEIDTGSGEYTRLNDYGDQMAGLVILDKFAGEKFGPVRDGWSLDLASGAADSTAAQNDSTTVILSEAKDLDASEGDSSVAVLPQNDGEGAAQNDVGSGTPVTVTLELSEAAANGLYEITYDTSVAQFAGLKSAADLSSYSVGSGTLTFAFASVRNISAGSAVATITFNSSSCEASLNVVCRQLNAAYPDTSSTLDAGAHSWGEWASVSAATCTAAGSESRTCSLCSSTQTREVAIDADAHAWGEWTEETAATADVFGTQTRSCSLCAALQRNYTAAAGAELTDAAHSFSTFEINEHAVGQVRIFGAAINSLTRLTTSDGSIVYLAELSEDAPENGQLSVEITPQKVSNGAGFGMAIKREKVDSVGWDSDDTEYTLTLAGGAGLVQAYAYENSTDCTPVSLCFVVGEGGLTNGSFYSTGDYDRDFGWDNYVKELGVWGADVVSATWYEDDDDSQFEVYFRLSESTPDDAQVNLEFIREKGGSVYAGSSAEGEDIALSGAAVQLTDGSADFEFVAAGGGGTRHFTVHLRNSALTQDTDDDTPNTSDFTYGDVNSDDEINAKDVTLLKRYIAGWDGIEIDTAAADVNVDGEINAKDVTLLKRYLAGWEGIVLGGG